MEHRIASPSSSITVGRKHYSAPVDYIDWQVSLLKMQSMKLKSTNYKNG